MAYTKTNWQANDPITQDLMNKIEQGIADAHGFESRIAATETVANTASTATTTNANKIASLETTVGNLSTSVSQNAAFGQEAMTQIHAATDSHTPSYTNLDDRFTKIEQVNTTQTATIQAVSDSIDGAKRTENDTLRSRFEAVESTATTLINGYNSMTESLNNAGGTDAQGH